MWSHVLLLSSLLYAALSQAGPEQCRNYSDAPKYTQESARNLPAYNGTMAAVYNIWAHLYTRFGALGNPNLLNVFMGWVSSDDAILFYQCSATPIQCDGRTVGFTASITSRRIFNDRRLRYYEYNPITPSNSRLFKTGADYIPSSRPWWNTTGWAAPYVFFADNTLGQSWIMRPNADLRMGSDRRYSEPCGGCIDEARAIRAVWAISKKPDSRVTGVNAPITSQAQMEQIGSELYHAIKNHQFIPSVYVGYQNDEYYAIADCKTYENNFDPVCGGGGRDYVFIVRNEDFLKHKKRTAFEWDESAGKMGAQISTSDAEYFPTKRPWWGVKNGWSDQYLYVVPCCDISGRTFVQSYKASNGYEGVLAGDFLPGRENCQVVDPLRCKGYSYAESCVDEALKASDITGRSAAFEDDGEVAAVAKALVDSTTSSFASALFAGWTNGEMVLVHDCWNQIAYATTTEECERSGHRYLVYVGSTSLFDDSKGHVFAWEADWDGMGDEIFVTENDLVATKRPWYPVGDGWTEEYKFVSGEIGISFVGSFKTGLQGVLGADSVEEDCYSKGNQFRYIPEDEGLSKGAIAGIVIGSVGVVAILLVAIALLVGGAGGVGSGDYVAAF